MRAAGSASDLVDDREFAVPRELVFEAWTVPEHFARWFAPHGVEVALFEMDARPGDALRFHHRFPTGELVSIKGVFDEVVAPSRLRFTFTSVDADDQPTAPPRLPDWPVGVHIVMTVELHATRHGTRMTVQQRVAEPEAAGTPSVGGPHLAAAMIAANLVDEFHAFVHPIILGGGNPWLPRDLRIPLELASERRLGGVVHLHYRPAP
jgi:uncharacterized protein YndB with AHSA1/START domain